MEPKTNHYVQYIGKALMLAGALGFAYCVGRVHGTTRGTEIISNAWKKQMEQESALEKKTSEYEYDPMNRQR
jgi:hypothetical protein